MFRSNVGGRLTRIGLLHIFTKQYRDYFSKLADDSTVPKEDRQRIGDLLKKPWNLYIRRHSALTQKSAILKEHILRQHAGWSPRSQMHLKYLHYYGNESSTSLLQEYGILPRDNEETDVLRPKQCPNCGEPNRPDQKFCNKCRLVLSMDAFHDTLKEQQEKDEQIDILSNKISALEQSVKEMSDLLSEPKKLLNM
jgi:hypothetical protein